MAGCAARDGVEHGFDPQALAALHRDEPLVPGEVADHPRDRVHRLEAPLRVGLGQAAQPADPLGPGEPQLVDARMGHQRSRRYGASVSMSPTNSGGAGWPSIWRTADASPMWPQ